MAEERITIRLDEIAFRAICEGGEVLGDLVEVTVPEEVLLRLHRALRGSAEEEPVAPLGRPPEGPTRTMRLSRETFEEFCRAGGPAADGVVTLVLELPTLLRINSALQAAIRGGIFPGGKAAKAAQERFTEEEVFYGTDRAPSGATDPASWYGAGRGERLELGVCRVTIPADHVVGELESPSVFSRPDPEKHILLVEVVPKPSEIFFSELAARIAASAQRSAFVFIHGYNVSFEDAARRTAQMRHDLAFPGAPIFYSWPSRDATAAYTIDQATNRWTVPHLQEFLAQVSARSGAELLHVIAHSMGCRAVTEVLRRFATEPGRSVRLNQIVLVAPDVDAAVFRDEIAPSIARLGERVTLYASANDQALELSERVHGHPRAGDLAGLRYPASQVQTIDASEVDTSLLRLIRLGHSYFAKQPTVIEDLSRTLAGGEPGSEPRRLQARSMDGYEYWRIPAAG